MVVRGLSENFEIMVGSIFRGVDSAYFVREDALSEDPGDLVKEASCEGCVSQIIPACLVIAYQQLLLPALLTFEAYKKGGAVSRKPELQYLLFFLGTRQISEALAKLRYFWRPPYILVRSCVQKRCVKKVEGWREVMKEEVGNWVDLNSVAQLYGVKLASKEREEALKTVLTAISYSKLVMR